MRFQNRPKARQLARGIQAPIRVAGEQGPPGSSTNPQYRVVWPLAFCMRVGRTGGGVGLGGTLTGER